MSGTPPAPEKDSHPNRGTLGAPPFGGHLNLSARQLHDHENEPSWQAPREKGGRWSTRRVVTLAILLAVLALVVWLKVTGVV